MFTSKIKHLPFNLVWELPSLIVMVFVLTTFGNVSTELGWLLSLLWYFNGVRTSVNADYIEQRIEKLEQKGTPYNY